MGRSERSTVDTQHALTPTLGCSPARGHKAHRPRAQQVHPEVSSVKVCLRQEQVLGSTPSELEESKQPSWGFPAPVLRAPLQELPCWPGRPPFPSDETERGAAPRPWNSGLRCWLKALPEGLSQTRKEG